MTEPATPRILFAHERRGIARAVTRVLQLSGFSVVWVADGDAARQALRDGHFAGLVVDVALGGVPGYELCAEAKEGAPQRGADVVILVASVYRRTSYKRRPSRLYGADDYVEIHHLCDSLPAKLRQHLGIAAGPGSDDEQQRAREALRQEGDARMEQTDEHALAGLIVADMVLYNGDAILGAKTMEDAAQAIAADLDIARELYAHVQQAEGKAAGADDPVGAAFRRLMRTMGREAEAIR